MVAAEPPIDQDSLGTRSPGLKSRAKTYIEIISGRPIRTLPFRSGSKRLVVLQ